MREITIRIGEVLSFAVDIQGEPPPDTTWSKDGKTLSETDYIKIGRASCRERV